MCQGLDTSKDMRITRKSAYYDNEDLSSNRLHHGDDSLIKVTLVMSYAVMSIHPPTKIVGGVPINDRHCVICRGNEIVSLNLHDYGLEPLKTFRIFGNITCVESYGGELFVLLSTEVLLCLSVSHDRVTCKFKCGFGKKIGKLVDIPLFSVGAGMVAVHTRVRTCYLLNISAEKWFPVLLPFETIYHVQCIESGLMVFGKSFNKNLEMSLFSVDWDKLEITRGKTVAISESIGSVRSFFVCGDGSFIASVDKTVLAFDQSHRRTILDSKNDIHFVSMINNRLIGCDANGILDLNDGTRLLRVPGISRLCPLSESHYLQLSDTNDAHLLKFDDLSASICDTYVQLNVASLMDRSSFVSDNGTVRSLVNGMATAKQVQVDIFGGANIWTLEKMALIVVSTRTSTAVFDDQFAQVNNWISRAERSVYVCELSTCVMQVTAHQLILDGVVAWESPSEEVILCSTWKDTVAVVVSARNVEIFTVEEKELKHVNRLEFPKDISAMSISSDAISLSYWDQPIVHTFSLRDGTEIDTFSVDTLLISSIVYDSCGELLVGGFGDVFVNRKRIPVSTSSVVLRSIRDKVMILSDVCCSLSGEEVRVFDAPLMPIDIAAHGSRGFVVLTKDAFFLITPESEYHTHVEDKVIINHKISLFAIDEENNCPLVFAAQKGDGYNLVSPVLSAVKLHTREVPRAMLWICYKTKKYLVVGLEDGSQGLLLVLNIRLERVSETRISDPVDAITYVNQEYIAVASSSYLLLYEFDDEMRLVLRAKAPTRVKCSSLTSPNSCAIVYADRFASVIIFTAIEGQLAEIYRDYNPKGLRFARLESETEVLAIGMNSAIYSMAIDKGRLTTTSAFNVGAVTSSVLNSPDLAFLTSCGSSQVIFKCDQTLSEIFKIMSWKVKDVAGLTIHDYRTVFSNGKPYPFGKFVDGDFLLLFLTLSDDEQALIARLCHLPIDVVREKIEELAKRVDEYRIRTQKSR